MEKAPVIYSMLCDIDVMADGYTPTTQNYDAVSGIFFPDYSASPLNLFPRCVLIDPDSPVASKTCNSMLKSFEWFEVTKSGTTSVYSKGGTAASGYEVICDSWASMRRMATLTSSTEAFLLPRTM